MHRRGTLRIHILNWLRTHGGRMTMRPGGKLVRIRHWSQALSSNMRQQLLSRTRRILRDRLLRAWCNRLHLLLAITYTRNTLDTCFISASLCETWKLKVDLQKLWEIPSWTSYGLQVEHSQSTNLNLSSKTLEWSSFGIALPDINFVATYQSFSANLPLNEHLIGKYLVSASHILQLTCINARDTGINFAKVQKSYFKLCQCTVRDHQTRLSAQCSMSNSIDSVVVKNRGRYCNVIFFRIQDSGIIAHNRFI